MPDELRDFRPEEISRVLVAHGVRFVVIGGLAAQFHGSMMLTRDIDVTPAMDEVNLTRLSAALTELGARVRHPDVPEGLPFGHDATSLAAALFWNLTTPYGDLDLSFHPAGTDGYDDLQRDAVVLVYGGTPTPVASLRDVIRSKDAANRDKDRRMLPELRRILDLGPDRGQRPT